MTPTTPSPALDYIIIDQKTENADFLVRYSDGNSICFQYGNDHDTVRVVPPHDLFSCWESISKPTGTLAIPSHVQREDKKYTVTEIREWAFCDCDSLLSVTIPHTVTDIGAGCFNGCSSLQTIIVEEGNPEYDSRQHCNAVIETATGKLIAGCQNTVIPPSVTSISNYAFYASGNLHTLVIPPSVTEIGNATFRYCSNLQTIDIPPSVTEIGIRAFEGCRSLQTIAIPHQVKEIADWVFAGCSSLHAIVIPDSVQKIGEEAFRDCASLETITIPPTVTDLGYGVFRGCSSLRTISIQDPTLLDNTGIDRNKVQIES